MITANGCADDGGELLLLGITDANIVELKKGRPIRCRHETHPAVPPGRTVVIIWGPTEQAIYDKLRAKGLLDGARIETMPGALELKAGKEKGGSGA